MYSLLVSTSPHQPQHLQVRSTFGGSASVLPWRAWPVSSELLKPLLPLPTADHGRFADVQTYSDRSEEEPITAGARSHYRHEWNQYKQVWEFAHAVCPRHCTSACQQHLVDLPLTALPVGECHPERANMNCIHSCFQCGDPTERVHIARVGRPSHPPPYCCPVHCHGGNAFSIQDCKGQCVYQQCCHLPDAYGTTIGQAVGHLAQSSVLTPSAAEPQKKKLHSNVAHGEAVPFRTYHDQLVMVNNTIVQKPTGPCVETIVKQESRWGAFTGQSTPAQVAAAAMPKKPKVFGIPAKEEVIDDEVEVLAPPARTPPKPNEIINLVDTQSIDQAVLQTMAAGSSLPETPSERKVRMVEESKRDAAASASMTFAALRPLYDQRRNWQQQSLHLESLQPYVQPHIRCPRHCISETCPAAAANSNEDLSHCRLSCFRCGLGDGEHPTSTIPMRPLEAAHKPPFHCRSHCYFDRNSLCNPEQKCPHRPSCCDMGEAWTALCVKADEGSARSD